MFCTLYCCLIFLYVLLQYGPSAFNLTQVALPSTAAASHANASLHRATLVVSIMPNRAFRAYPYMVTIKNLSEKFEFFWPILRQMQKNSEFETCIEVSKKKSNKSLKWRKASLKT